MNSEISPENERFIQHAHATGLYPDRGKVLDEAVSLLKQRQELLEHIDSGVKQLRNGEFTVYDDDSLWERFQQLEQRAAGHLSSDVVAQLT